ncbi:MAG: cadherin-like beta sandwich domain-containing protein, partial [Nitrospirota bacterium]
SVTVTATAQDAGATVSINNQAGTSRSVTLNGPGTGTLVSIVVTAPNGNPKTYLVTVNQAALASNAGLSNLAVNTGTLTPGFVAPGVSGLPGYTVAVPNATTSITVTAVRADPNATLTISPSATINNLPVGNTVFTIEVTAPNGNQKIYFVTVTRAAPGGNNNLSGLAVSAGALVPSPFAAATTSYTVAVSNTTLSTTVTATVADSTATLKINNAAATSGIAAGPIALAVGPNSIPIEVTAQDLTTKTYTVTVTRAAPGGNNNLSGLAVSAGALVPSPFAAATTSYTVAVSNTTLSTTVTATVADSTATLKINNAAATSGIAAGPIALAVGPNSIPIEVTAQDLTTKTYTVVITRAP